MTLTTPNPANHLAHHKKTHLTMSHYERWVWASTGKMGEIIFRYRV